MFKVRHITAGVLALAFVACKDTLVVQDLTDPDRDRALGRPADVEAFIGSTYAQIQNATLGGSNDDLQTQLQVMGMENTSALANFAMGPRGSIPRSPLPARRRPLSHSRRPGSMGRRWTRPASSGWCGRTRPGSARVWAARPPSARRLTGRASLPMPTRVSPPTSTSP